MKRFPGRFRARGFAGPIRSLAPLSAALLFCALLAGCAVIDKDHRPLTRVVEKYLIPDDNYLLAAATFPVWAVAGVVTLPADGLVLNPVFSAPAAADDATLAFTGFGVVMPLEIALILPRAAAVPVIFLGSEIARCTIPYVF